MERQGWGGIEEEEGLSGRLTMTLALPGWEAVGASLPAELDQGEPTGLPLCGLKLPVQWAPLWV